jgi:hypothetical protein
MCLGSLAAGEFPAFQTLIRQWVVLLERRVSCCKASAYTGHHNKEETRIYIYALNGIRTHDPSAGKVKNHALDRQITTIDKD